jgi:hypothetical protein
MRSRRQLEAMRLLAISAVGAVALSTGCFSGDEGVEAPRAAQAVRAPDGSLRRPFLGGAFVTWNGEMPIEVDQAIAGEVPDRPVVVWAGN